jgi:hypothetical protein
MRTTFRCASPTWKNRFLQSYDAHRTVGDVVLPCGRSPAPVGRCASLSRWMHCIGLTDLVLPRGRCRSPSWKTRVYRRGHCIVQARDPWRSTGNAVLLRGRASSSDRRCMPCGWKTHVFQVGEALHTMGRSTSSACGLRSSRRPQLFYCRRHSSYGVGDVVPASGAVHLPGGRRAARVQGRSATG